jgi:RNA polymerase sigma-54 factor
MNISQRTQPRIRQTTTAHLTQTMSMLELPRSELREWLNSSLGSNPALELVEPEKCPSCHRFLYHPGPCPVCHPRKDEPIVFLAAPSSRRKEDTDGENRPEPTQPVTLADHILAQIGPELAADERTVAVYLLARLNENGLMPEPPSESARFLHAPLSTVEKVLHAIQHCDPTGVGALSPVEALLIQIDALAESETVPVGVREMVSAHLEELARGEFGSLARELHLSRREVEEAARFIKMNLTPYPGRAFFTSGSTGRAAADPDLYREAEMVFRLAPNNTDGPLMVEVFTPLAGTLRVNPEFRTMVRTLTGADREKWGAKVEEALLIDKCLRQSQNTMLRLAAALAEEQRAFILGSDRESHPLTRATLAVRLGVHESTISRAVSNKRAALPNGRIVPLARFFDRSLSVRDLVRSIIVAESKPLSDTEVVKLLQAQGVLVARRTVAKYRAMEGILPASLRKSQRTRLRARAAA